MNPAPPETKTTGFVIRIMLSIGHAVQGVKSEWEGYPRTLVGMSLVTTAFAQVTPPSPIEVPFVTVTTVPSHTPALF